MIKSMIKMLFFPIFTIATALLLCVVIYEAEGNEDADISNPIVIKYIQDEYEPVFFDHLMHMDLAESCGECHHVHNEEINSTCSDCHSINSDTFKGSVESGFPPCSGCHDDYDIDAPEMPGLKVAFHRKCFACHVGIGELGISPGGCVEMCHAR